MAEPISDERLRQVRALVDFPSDHPVNCHPVNLADVVGLIARLDRAEAEVAKVRSEPDSDDRPGSLLDIEIGDVGFPTHVSNRLLYNNIRTVRDLVSKTQRDLTRMRHIGRKSLLIINSRLSAMGLSLKEIPGIAALKAAGVEPNG